MWCCKCDRDLSECVCPDIKERLNSAAATGTFAYRKCVKCGEHYSRCKCEQPEWNIGGGGKCLEKKKKNDDKKENRMNEKTEGAARRIQGGEIKDKLEGVKKLSFCILTQSRLIRDFFLGEPPTDGAKDSRPRETGGYFSQVKNDLDDAHGYLKEALDVLVLLGKEIGVDIEKAKISERPERRD